MSSKLRLGIDAFNISSGGGLTHLKELIYAANLAESDFETVYLWASENALNKIENQTWLIKMHDPLLNGNLFSRLYWHKFKSTSSLMSAKCDIVFTPGGTCLSNFKPSVTMCRNMLPFEWAELLRYGWSLKTLKFIQLSSSQRRSFEKVNGLIFLTEYAQKAVLKIINRPPQSLITIPHGVSSRFSQPLSRKRDFTFSDERPCRLIYVSDISPYKHQWNVIEAIHKIKKLGFPVTLEIIGSPAEGMPKLEKALKRCDPHREFIFFDGAVQHSELHLSLAKADIGIFASSCENLPNILLEMMAAGLPIACSNMGPMPEVLGDAGEYFDPLSYEDIAVVIEKLISSDKLRVELSAKAIKRSSKLTWHQCASRTLEFLANVARNQREKRKKIV